MPQRLPPRLRQAYEAGGDPALQAAADVARGVHAAGATPAARPSPAAVRRLKAREAEALRGWARQAGRLLDAARFETGWIAQGRIGGQENDVYLEGNRVLKRNNLCFHLSHADFLDRLALHSLLFPGAPPRLEGFVEHAGELRPVFSQPAVRAQRGARRDEVEAFMCRLDFTRVRHDDYQHAEGLLVEDLHAENVFIDEQGEVIVIDPVIYLVGTRPAGKRSSSPASPSHPSRRKLLDRD